MYSHEGGENAHGYLKLSKFGTLPFDEGLNHIHDHGQNIVAPMGSSGNASKPLSPIRISAGHQNYPIEVFFHFLWVLTDGAG